MSDEPKRPVKELEEYQVEFAEKLQNVSQQNLNEAVTAARNVINALLPSIKSSRALMELHVTFPLMERRIHEERVAELNLRCAVRIRDREARNIDHEKAVENVKQAGIYHGLYLGFQIISTAHHDLFELQSEQLDELTRLLKEENATSIANTDRRNQIAKMQQETEMRRAAIGVVHTLFETVSKRMDRMKGKLTAMDPDLSPWETDDPK